MITFIAHWTAPNFEPFCGGVSGENRLWKLASVLHIPAKGFFILATRHEIDWDLFREVMDKGNAYTGYIYFLKFKKQINGKTGCFFKIGFSADPKTRIRTIKHLHYKYSELEVIGAFQGTVGDEKLLHRFYSEYRI